MAGAAVVRAEGAMSDYAAFLASKRREWTGHGIVPSPAPDWLWPFQAALRDWALRKGRAALFCDTGTGKTRMQVSWAAEIPGRVLILAPLGRRFVGIELKPEYAAAAVKNLRRAESLVTDQMRLFEATP